MIVSAEKIVEAPKTEIASDTTVTGHAPPEAPVVAKAEPAPAPAPEPARAEPAPAQPAPAAAEPAQQETLPKTASQMPLIGLLGLAFIAAGFILGRVRVN